MSTAEAPTRSATLSCAPPFSHRLALEDGSARLSLRGEYDIAAEPRLASLLDRCTAGAALVIVDLSAVEFLSCGRCTGSSPPRGTRERWAAGSSSSADRPASSGSSTSSGSTSISRSSTRRPTARPYTGFPGARSR